MKFDPMRMHGIIRYANRNRIKNEDLAQHSYSVAYYCFEIAEKYHITKETRNKAIAMAIIHDIGEVFTSDLPHDVKYENPELKQLCDKLERKYVHEQLPSAVAELWDELEDKEHPTLAGAIVKLGDSLSVNAYVDREIELGNTSSIICEIKQEIQERIIEQEKTISQMIIGGYK